MGSRGSKRIDSPESWAWVGQVSTDRLQRYETMLQHSGSYRSTTGEQRHDDIRQTMLGYVRSELDRRDRT